MGRTLITNGTILTMNQTRDQIRGDVLIENRRIVAVGDVSSEMKNGIASSIDDVIDATDQIVMPGLIQGHIHLCQTLFRGLADDMELLDWLRDRIWPLEAAHTKDSLYLSAMLGCAELIRGGTTCIVDMATVRNTESVFRAIHQTGIRAICGKAMMDWGTGVPAALLESTAESLRASHELCERWHGQDDNRIQYAYMPRFAVSCSDQLLRSVAELARKDSIRIHTHAAENPDEVNLVLQERGDRNVVYLAKAGLIGPHVSFAHCIWLQKEEIDILAQTGSAVVHCPSSNLKLASGIAPIPTYLARGVRVALGSDGAACANNLNGFLEMRLAALIHKVASGAKAMPAAKVLAMATIEGAEAFGLEKEIGSIEPGKRADLILINPQKSHNQPAGSNLAGQIVYSLQAADVEMVMIDGRIVFQSGILQTIDEGLIRDQAQAALRQLLPVLGT